MVTSRDFNSTAEVLTMVNKTVDGTWLQTEHYSVFIQTSTGLTAAPHAKVATRDGAVVWQSSDTVENQNLLHWPAPLSAKAYGLVDHPRIYVPPWASTPMPSGQKLHQSTNGYDLTNNVDKDTYVFLLGNDLNGWYDGRRDFVKLVGATPLLPDYAYGTWYDCNSLAARPPPPPFPLPPPPPPQPSCSPSVHRPPPHSYFAGLPTGTSTPRRRPKPTSKGGTQGGSLSTSGHWT
jgi:hypothetical protein